MGSSVVISRSDPLEGKIIQYFKNDLSVHVIKSTLPKELQIQSPFVELTIYVSGNLIVAGKIIGFGSGSRADSSHLYEVAQSVWNASRHDANCVSDSCMHNLTSENKHCAAIVCINGWVMALSGLAHDYAEAYLIALAQEFRLMDGKQLGLIVSASQNDVVDQVDHLFASAPIIRS